MSAERRFKKAEALGKLWPRYTGHKCSSRQRDNTKSRDVAVSTSTLEVDPDYRQRAKLLQRARSLHLFPILVIGCIRLLLDFGLMRAAAVSVCASPAKRSLNQGLIFNHAFIQLRNSLPPLLPGILIFFGEIPCWIRLPLISHWQG